MGLRAVDWLILLGTIVVIGAVITSTSRRESLPSLARRKQLRANVPGEESAAPAADPERAREWSFSLPVIFWRAAWLAAALLALFIWTAERSRPQEQGRASLVAAWLMSLALVTLTVWHPSPGAAQDRFRAWASAHRTDLWLVAGLTLLAMIPAFIAIGTHPWAFNGDEGSFALSAKRILDGAEVNPFGTGWLSHPNLSFFMEAATMATFGDTVAGARMASAIPGVLAVPLAYALAAMHFDRATGITAAVILGTYHVHLFWSRSALNNGISTFFMLMTLVLLSLAIQRRSGTVFLLTGITIGLAQFFYMGNRVLPGAAAAILLCEGARLVIRPDRREALIAWLRQIGLVAIGAVVAALPLLAHFSRFPDELTARDQHVSIFQSGWLDAQRATGRSTLDVMLDQIRDAVQIPFNTAVGGQYRGEPPFIGWPIALPLLIGLVIATARLHKRRYGLIVLPYWVIVAGMVTTVPPMATNRFVAATPLICVLAAIGIREIATLLQSRLRAPSSVVWGTAAAVVAVMSIWSLNYFFHDGNQVQIYSDPNTQIAEHLARDILAVDPGATVYFAAPPRMWYDGFSDLVFRTPDATGISVNDPWRSDSAQPELKGTTIFVFLPERSRELDVIRTWFPGGEKFERASDDFGLLYIAYIVRR